MTGTVRTLDPNVRDLIEEAHRGSGRLGIAGDVRRDGASPLPPRLSGDRQRRRADRLCGGGGRATSPATTGSTPSASGTMGGEDFAYMLQARPGAYIFLGNGDPSELHTDTYDFNDEIIPVGVELLGAAGRDRNAARAVNKLDAPETLAVAEPWWKLLLRTLLTLLISAAGELTAQALQLPAGLIMGGSVAVAIAAIAGVKVVVPPLLRDIAFVLTGASMGTSVARDSLGLIGQWPVSSAGLVVELILIVFATGWMLQKLFGLDKGTAYLSSFPGHLSFIMAFATAGVGDPRQIAIIQVIRILILVVCVPIGALFLPVEHVGPLVVQQQAVMGLPMLLALIAGCAAMGFVFTRLRVPAGYVLGAMFAATTAKLMGWFDGAMPPLLLTVTFVVIGALIGSRLGGTTMTELRKAAIGGFIATGMTVAIVTAVAWGVSGLVDMPFGQIWLGLAPGALEGMGVMGISLGYDPAFIAAHHVARLLLLTIAIPVVVLMVSPRRPKRP